MDGITIETLESDAVVAEWIYTICVCSWKSGRLPDDFTVVIASLHKGMGGKDECKTREISLLSIPGKVFGSIVIGEDKGMQDK